MNSELYVKDKNGDFVKLGLNLIDTNDWDGKLILIKVDSEKQDYLEDVMDALEHSDVIMTLDNTSFLITNYGIHFAALDQENGQKLVEELQRKLEGKK